MRKGDDRGGTVRGVMVINEERIEGLIVAQAGPGDQGIRMRVGAISWVDNYGKRGWGWGVFV